MFTCEKHNRTFSMTGDCPECSGEYQQALQDTFWRIVAGWDMHHDEAQGIAILKALVDRYR